MLLEGVTIAVNQNGRWAPAYAAATKLIQEGAIGKPYWIHHQLLSCFDWFGGKDCTWLSSVGKCTNTASTTLIFYRSGSAVSHQQYSPTPPVAQIKTIKAT